MKRAKESIQTAYEKHDGFFNVIKGQFNAIRSINYKGLANAFVDEVKS